MKVIVFTISIIVILGGLYFYQQTWNTYTEKVPKKSLEEFVKQNTNKFEETAAQEQKNKDETPQDQSSILARLFKPSLFISKLDNIWNNPAEVAEESEESQKIKMEIRNYLIASSDIGFPNDSAKLKAALGETAEGDPGALTEIRNEYEKNLEEFEKLEPPEVMLGIHNQSVEVVKRFIALLNDTIHQTNGLVDETWDSKERTDINNLALETKAAIINIVEKYQINLPQGVLSY